MHHVVAGLDALDPEAGAAIRVIRRFDELIEGGVGLEPILAAVAVLTGAPARLVDARFAVDLRADVEAHVQRNTGPADPHWPHAPLEPGGRPAFCWSASAHTPCSTPWSLAGRPSPPARCCITARRGLFR
ncbi:MAG TPA: hypothetical protein VGJ45_04860 [Pseudonocardiaceae bacterium]|jgi:hypothetical protein